MVMRRSGKLLLGQAIMYCIRVKAVQSIVFMGHIQIANGPSGMRRARLSTSENEAGS